MSRLCSVSSISPAAYDQLKRQAQQKGLSIKVYLEQMIGFFTQTNWDPAQLPEQDVDQSLGRLKKQVDFIVRIIRRIESDSLHPLADSVFGLEQSMQQLLGPERPAYPPVEQINCPKCQRVFPRIELSAQSEVICPHCDFRLPLQVGNQALEMLDLYAILGGGLTRPLHNLEIQGRQVSQARAGLNQEAKLSLQAV
ncbi:MAG: BfmA/BtgA family mobilization protein [Bacteroidota bacterium]